MSAPQYTGWAVIEEGRGIVYVKQDHNIPEVGEFSAMQEWKARLNMGHKVSITRVLITPIPRKERS